MQEKLLTHILSNKLTIKDGSTISRDERGKLIPVQGRENFFFDKEITDDDIAVDVKVKNILIKSNNNKIVLRVDFISLTTYEIY